MEDSAVQHGKQESVISVHDFKVLVVGSLGTGKTSIINRTVKNHFTPNYFPTTIGADSSNMKVLDWDRNTQIRLRFWDIAGQERVINMTRVYYRGAVGAFVLFDVTESASFDAVQMWKDDVDTKVALPNGQHIPAVLLANKCDKLSKDFQDRVDHLDAYCQDKGFHAWFETSAKEDIGIDEAIRCLTAKMLENDKANNEPQDDPDAVTLETPQHQRKCSC